ncbi:MAG: hypothetical protein ACXV3U_05560 [Halobacteriota archaeon]
MTCEAEEQALAEMHRRRRKAADEVRRVTARAELEVARLNDRIYNWGAVRLAEAMMRLWDSRCTQAANALERCKQRARNREVIERFG